MNKSTLEEIEQRFDGEVDRFSNLETGQATTLDAVYNMDLITDAIAKIYPDLAHVLDIGCGAGNYDVKLMEKVGHTVNFTLVDLSLPMLKRAEERLSEVTKGDIELKKGDFRCIELGSEKFDVIIATAVLHHLRDDADWFRSLQKLFGLLRPGGSLWVFDLVQQSETRLQNFIYVDKYGAYLTALKDEAYRDHVYAYIEKEDSPRALRYQLDTMEKVGFKDVDVLHKKLCFASFVGFK